MSSADVLWVECRCVCVRGTGLGTTFTERSRFFNTDISCVEIYIVMGAHAANQPCHAHTVRGPCVFEGIFSPTQAGIQANPHV